MPYPEDNSGYDPIVGVQPENPTHIMSFSLLKRPKPGSKIGPPKRRPQHAFNLKITSHRFMYWSGTKWTKFPETKKEMPFIVAKGLNGSGGKIVGNKQFAIWLEPNEKYRGKFPACIEVRFRTAGPREKYFNHVGRAVRFD